MFVNVLIEYNIFDSMVLSRIKKMIADDRELYGKIRKREIELIEKW